MAIDVKFKQGLLANLPILANGTGATEGTIYMTTDEGGIYLGLAGGEFKRMGDFIMVDNIAALNTLATTQENISQHALYYAKAENVLCRYDGTKFEQINKQVTAQQLISLLENTAAAGTSNDAIVTSTIYDKSENQVTQAYTRYAGAGAVTKVVASNEIVNGGESQAVVTIHAEDTVSTLAAAGNQLTLTNAQTYGSGKTDTITLEGVGSLKPTLTSSGNKITVTVQAPKTNTAVTSSNNKATITESLLDNNENPIEGTGSSFNIVGAGDNTVSVSGNTITVSGTDTVSALSATGNKITLTNTKAGSTESDEITLAASGDLKPTLTSNGDTITVNVQAPSLEAGFDANGKLSIAQLVNGSDIDTEKTASVTPTIKYGSDGSQVAKFVNGQAVLSVPTVAEVNELLQNLDAMTFKGAISATEIADIETANKGDTYKLKTGGVLIDGVTSKIGDIIINNGEDGAAPEWQLIPSGDETILAYELVNGDNTVTLMENDSNDKGVISASPNDKILLENGVIKHAEYGASAGVTATNYTIPALGAASVNFSAYNALARDSYGHLTGWAAGTYTVNPIKTVEMTTAVTNNIATVTTSLLDTAGNSVEESATLAFSSDTLTFAKTSTGMSVDLEWGSF